MRNNREQIVDGHFMLRMHKLINEAEERCGGSRKSRKANTLLYTLRRLADADFQKALTVGSGWYITDAYKHSGGNDCSGNFVMGSMPSGFEEGDKVMVSNSYMEQTCGLIVEVFKIEGNFDGEDGKPKVIVNKDYGLGQYQQEYHGDACLVPFASFEAEFLVRTRARIGGLE